MKKIFMFYPNIPNKEGLINSIEKVINDRFVGYGDKVEEFEKKFAEKFGLKYTLALNSCTSGLRLGLAISGVGPKDEVITPAYTCSATNHPILEQFATPVFTDSDYNTGNIDPKDIEHRITEKTKAIMVVHWAGYPVELDEINKIAKKHDLKVIEDAAHAMGVTYKGKPIGSISDFTSFSFQAIKHITTGNGGMLTLIDPKLHKEAFRRSWYGIDRHDRKQFLSEDDYPGYYDFGVTLPGYKYDMSCIQAVMGLHGLKYFDQEFNRRAQLAEKYNQELLGIPGIKLFQYKDDRTSGNWLYCMHVENRANFYRMMKSKGIETSIVHKRNDADPVFGGRRDDLPQVDRISKDVISIPMHSGLTSEDIDYIIKSIKDGW